MSARGSLTTNFMLFYNLGQHLQFQLGNLQLQRLQLPSFANFRAQYTDLASIAVVHADFDEDDEHTFWGQLPRLTGKTYYLSECIQYQLFAAGDLGYRSKL